MRKYLLLVIITILCFFTTHTFAQGKIKGSLKGTVVDTVGGHQVLSNATVALTPEKGDSTDADFVITDKKGAFHFSGLDSGTYRLVISYEGYLPIRKTITVNADARDFDLATLYMERNNDMMAAVVVQRPPISIKKDTVEYNAGMFATKPNAVAEDLLKKMPGIQVDKSGTVTAQGETVARVLVNGKRFFSDDPKMATRNLPPDIIDKIQVFDDLSDQSKFTGFDDGNRVKTINIVTKKDKRQGYFGKFAAGAGTNQNYDEMFNLHRFDGEQQISILGQANDVNKQNFSQADIFGNGGGRRNGGGGGGGGNGGGGGSGITTVWAGGANYKNALSSKTDLTASYFYNQQHVSTFTQDSIIKPYDGDTVRTSAGNSYSISRSENHRIFMNLESRLDSNNSLVFRPNVTFQHSDPNASSSSYTVDNYGSPINSSVSHSNSTTNGFNINGTNFQFRHKFKKPFRTISLDMNVTSNVNSGTGYNYSINSFYMPTVLVDTLNQYYTNSYHGTTLSPTLSYTEPIAKNQILEFNYNHSYTNNRTLNNTFDFDETTHSYSHLDSLFTNSYKFVSNSDRFTLNWRIQNTKFNLSAGSGVQLTNYNSDNTTKGIVVSRNYVNVTPTVNFQYLWSRTSHLRVFYSGRTGQPSASQLQPLTTTSDQINFTVGNQNLKPQFTHSLRVLYTNFDPGTQRVMFATINASTTVNDIQSLFWYHANGGQTTTYRNLNGTWNVSGYFNYGFPIKTPKSNLNFITNVNYSQSQSLQALDSLSAIAEVYKHIYVHNTSMTETISWTTNIKKNFDMNFSSATTYNIARKTAPMNSKGETVTTNTGSLNSFSEVLSAEITAYTNNGWLIATSFDYTYTNTQSSGYNASVPLLNPSIAKQLFKKKNGEIRLTVFDLLNQNVAVSKTVNNQGQVTYNRNNVLTRYAMLTFTYNLNNFAGSNQRRMPGFFRGGRGGGGFGPPPGGGGGFRGGPLE